MKFKTIFSFICNLLIKVLIKYPKYLKNNSKLLRVLKIVQIFKKKLTSIVP